MCFDLTHAPVASTSRAAATGPVSMSTRPDPEGSDTVYYSIMKGEHSHERGGHPVGVSAFLSIVFGVLVHVLGLQQRSFSRSPFRLFRFRSVHSSSSCSALQKEGKQERTYYFCCGSSRLLLLLYYYYDTPTMLHQKYANTASIRQQSTC